MKNIRFSLQNMNPSQRTSLENILDKTNNEYENEYQVLTEKEAIINQHRVQFQNSLKHSKNRIQNLLKYSNDLDSKRNMIDSERSSLETQVAEALKYIESEMKINENTLSRTQHELELVLQKLSYTKTNSTQLQTKLNNLESIEQKMISRQTELEDQIDKSKNLPKRSPEKIQKEINVLNQNIPEVNKQIQSRENYIIQREMRRIQSQNERLKLQNQIESIKKEISENLQKSGLKNDVMKVSITSKIDQITTLETTRMEKKIMIENIKSRIEFQQKKAEELTKSVKDAIQKVEDTKNILAKKSNETELSRQKYEELQNSIQVQKSRKAKNDSLLVSELINIRKEYKKTQKKCGSELYIIQQNRNMKKELKETLKNYQKQLFQAEVESKQLKLEKNELNQLEQQLEEEELKNERQFKLDIITLDDLQKNIGRGQLKTKQIMKDQLELFSPTISTVEQVKSLAEIEQKYEEESKVLNTSMNIKDLKKELKQVYASIEDLKFECVKYKEQKKYNKQQLLLKRVDLEHAKSIQQYFEHEKMTHDENKSEEQLVNLRIKEYEISDLIRKIEKKHEDLLNRKKNLKIRLAHISEVINNQNVNSFGNNVSLVVNRDFDHNDNNDLRSASLPPLHQFDVRKIVELDKLENFYKTVLIEKKIWRDLINPSSIASILETWNTQLRKFID